MINGLIIQKKGVELYKGIEGENWFFLSPGYDALNKYIEEEIEKSWCDGNYVDACNDIHFIKQYLRAADTISLQYRIILCETDKPHPILSDYINNINFLGYDYAYSGGSFYSAVLNDLVMRKFSDFIDIELNENGLIDSAVEMNKFISIRNELIRSKNTDFEMGDFVIYKLYEIEKNFLI